MLLNLRGENLMGRGNDELDFNSGENHRRKEKNWALNEKVLLPSREPDPAESR